MNYSGNLHENSDTLIGLLTAQCADLEKLLMLAREETAAAQEGKFFKILDIVSERAEIADKLETFQKQISDLRRCLDSVKQATAQQDAVNRVVELAQMTIEQDNETRLLLTASRDEAARSMRNLERTQHNSNAYLRGGQKGLAYSRNF